MSRDSRTHFPGHFERLCEHVVVPTLERVVADDLLVMDRRPSVCLDDETGRTSQNAQAHLNQNRRVGLRDTRNDSRLWFVAWDPYVLLFCGRRGGIVRHHLPQEITPRLVEEAGRGFLKEMHAAAESASGSAARSGH